MIVTTADLDLTDEIRIVAYATNVWTIQVVNEAGDPLDLSVYDGVKSTFRYVETNADLAGSVAGDIVYPVPFDVADITPETHCRFVDQAAGIIEMVLGSTTEFVLRNSPCPVFLAR